LRFLRDIKATEVFEIRSASNIVNYNWTAFLKFQKVKKPKDSLIDKFNRTVDPIYKQIYNLGYQNQYLKEARDILLPRLMTGMIEVDKVISTRK
jgi:type I restriction enzyme S subunit